MAVHVPTETIDETKLHAFVGKMLGDIGAAATAALVLTGDRTGLYRSLDCDGPATPAELASRTHTHERYVREWLANQLASGYLERDAATDRYRLPPEHAMLLAREESPLNVQGLFEGVQTMMFDESKITRAFSDGQGVGWDQRHPQLFSGTARLFKPGYVAHLATEWIPSLDGVAAKLEAGGKIADVGCGFGTSTLVIANAYPKATIVGFDYHDGSIRAAEAAARDAGVTGRTTFATAKATDFPGTGYDLITCFDCVHDMGDPVGALAHMREALAPGGTLMIVEPFAGDSLEENLTPLGRIFYAFSTMICTPAAHAQSGGYTLGAQCGEPGMRDVATKAGFTSFRRATQTPFNLVYELRA